MFQTGANAPNDRGMSRPVVIAIIVLMVFLTAQDWGSDPRKPQKQLSAFTEEQLREEVREKARQLQ